MFSPVKTIIGGALVFALGGMLFIAQPLDQPEGAMPGAPSDSGSNGGFTLKFVAGTDTWNDGTVQPEEGFDEVTGRGETMDMEASDPRLSGTWTKVINCREGAPLFMVCVGSVRVENEGGEWLGTIQQSGASFGHPGPHWAHWTVLEGQGEYTGLTAIVDYDEETMGEGDINGVGVIFDFGTPPMPDPIEPSTD